MSIELPRFKQTRSVYINEVLNITCRLNYIFTDTKFDIYDDNYAFHKNITNYTQIQNIG